MFVRVDIIQGVAKSKRYVVIKCDECGCEKNINYCVANLEKAKKRPSFCSRACQVQSQKSGALRVATDNIFLERYGVSTPLLLDNVKQKRRDLSAEVIEKTKSTLMDRYGVDNPMKIKEVADKQQAKIRFGRDGKHHLQTDEGLSKRANTCLEKYGVDHPMRSKAVIEKFPFKDVWAKSHVTKKNNGTYAQSRSEKLFYAWLILVFGKKNVKKGVIVNGWSIDFEVNCNATIYVQYDGIYWHGKDTDERSLRQRQGARARRIIATYERDKLQNKWFAENGLLLQRVTDKEFERFIWQLRKKTTV